MELNLLQSIVLLGYFGEMNPSSQNHDPQKVFQSLQLHILHPMRHKLKDHLGLSYTSFKVFQVLGQFGETEPKYPNYRPRYTDSIPKSLISQFTFNEVSLKLKDYQRIKLHQGIGAWGLFGETGSKYPTSWAAKYPTSLAAIQRKYSEVLKSTFCI